MTTARFADRLDPLTYANDPVVGVFQTDPDAKDALWVSERLFSRLTSIARAYELHTLPMLGGSDPVALNRARCEALLDELEFVAERLDDALAAQTAQALTDYVATRIRQPAWGGDVTFEGE